MLSVTTSQTKEDVTPNSRHKIVNRKVSTTVVVKHVAMYVVMQDGNVRKYEVNRAF